MKRIEKFEKMAELETNKTNLENLLNDCESHYWKGVSFQADVRTDDYNKRYSSEVIHCNKDNFKMYLKAEIEINKQEINKLISSLQGGLPL